MPKLPWSKSNIEIAIRDMMDIAYADQNYRRDLLDPVFAKSEIDQRVETSGVPDWPQQVVVFYDQEDANPFSTSAHLTAQGEYDFSVWHNWGQ